MPIQNFNSQTFVAFIDISGFKELMKDSEKGLNALKCLYQSGYDALLNSQGVEGFFVSDCGILFVREGNTTEKLIKLLSVIKIINNKMLERNYMLTTSISFGHFHYQSKLEFDGIEKNPIYGNAYVKSFLDNETGIPRIQPGQCRIVTKDLPEEVSFDDIHFNLLKRKNNGKHLYYYWNLNQENEITNFERQYNDTYKSKYSGMLQALKNEE
jgi:hypothetical protein